MNGNFSEFNDGKYKSECNHDGNIVRRSEDRLVIGVAGVKRSCLGCGKNASENWSPNVYRIQLDDQLASELN